MLSWYILRAFTRFNPLKQRRWSVRETWRCVKKSVVEILMRAYTRSGYYTQ
jgi:hypothetical protein